MESTVPVKRLPYNGNEETITYVFKVKYNGTDENKEIHSIWSRTRFIGPCCRRCFLI